MHRLLLVAIVVGFILGGSGLAPNSARAYHTYEERLLDSTAYSLQRRRVRLGLFKLSYGIIDQLQISTYTMPWLLGLIVEDVAPNIELKSTFYQRKRLALSASLGFLSGTIEQIEGVERTKVRYFLAPVSLAASVRINSDVSTHIGGMFTGVSGDVDASPGATDIAGSTVVDILQFWGMVEWRLSRVVAFTFTVRWVPWVSGLIVRGSLDSDPTRSPSSPASFSRGNARTSGSEWATGISSSRASRSLSPEACLATSPPSSTFSSGSRGRGRRVLASAP
ncbi:MAG: hypothetical protein JRE82_16950 [Deltaproteobacteria bacterium]|nr:hypothetical protein [Deltaproteobacteria bacterium]